MSILVVLVVIAWIGWLIFTQVAARQQVSVGVMYHGQLMRRKKRMVASRLSRGAAAGRPVVVGAGAPATGPVGLDNDGRVITGPGA